jgi:hypothetical protein
MMTALGNLDIYIIKYDASGNFIWARQFGVRLPATSRFVILLSTGLVISTSPGFFRSTVDFDPGPGVFNVTCIGSGYAAFFLKLDNNGNFAWAKNIAQTDYGSNWHFYSLRILRQPVCAVVTKARRSGPGTAAINMSGSGLCRIYFIQVR